MIFRRVPYYRQSKQQIREAGAENQAQQLRENQNLFENLRLILQRLKIANNVTNIDELITRTRNKDVEVPGLSFRLSIKKTVMGFLTF